MRMRLLHDCDPGNDDAVALLVALAFGELVGVTTVAGNHDVDATTSNAAVACGVFEYTGDIARGAPRPLAGEFAAFAPTKPFSFYNDVNPESAHMTTVRTDLDGAGLIIERADAATWLVTTAPLTNVALALQRNPDRTRNLAGISILGGSATAGNITPVAEFNIWSDPEAANIVLASGIPIRMCGLDVTHQVLASKDFCMRIREKNTRCSRFVADLLDVFIDTYPDAFVGEPYAPLHDPCAVLAVTHPALFEWQSAHIEVELTGTLTRGMTVIDQRDKRSKHVLNVQLARACHRDGILAALLEAVELIGTGVREGAPKFSGLP